MENIFNFLEEMENIMDSMTGEAEITGEISDELKNELDALDIDKDAKVEQLCLKYKERRQEGRGQKAERRRRDHGKGKRTPRRLYFLSS